MQKQGVTALLISLCIAGTVLSSAIPADAAKWSGVDEAVIEKVAREHGREAGEPLIDLEQGDVGLFLFLIAGALGGFAAGYYWRSLLAENAQPLDAGKDMIPEEKK